jgi:Zn-dependent protease
LVKCDKCGVETYMPYRCNYCGGYFCDQHRLPEFHDCPGTYNQPKPSTVHIGSYSSTGGFQGNYSTSRIIQPYWFSSRELRDIAIGLVVIMALPLFKVWSYFTVAPLFVVGIAAVLAGAFLLHELAHKFAAQRFGMWAEFRLSMIGLLFTLLSFVLLQSDVLPIMIVAPGAVMIAGVMNWKEYGKISIAGPATNIAQALIYLIVYFATTNSLLGYLAFYGVSINSMLAIFNLIPFGIFDGFKIYNWDKRIWAVSAAVAGVLFLYTFF